MEIIVKDLNFSYKNSSFKFKKINVDLLNNEIYGIIGETGSGKTTFVELLNYLNIPDKGEIQIGEYNLNNYSRIKNIKDFRKNIGLVFQFSDEQFFEQSVKKEMEFALNNFNIDNKDSRIKDALLMVGLNETYLNKSPFKLSLGEKRLLSIATILVYNPKIIILDEPTIGLDLKNKTKIIKVLKKMKDNYDKKIIIVSHDIDMLYSLAQNFIIFKSGNIIKSGSKEEVFEDIEYLINNNINIPNILSFENLVLKEKKVKLGKYEEINDLIKAVYRNV